jgi:hypothetical protein
MIVAKELIEVTAMEFHTVVRIRVVVCGLAHNFYFCNYVFFLKKNTIQFWQFHFHPLATVN